MNSYKLALIPGIAAFLALGLFLEQRPAISQDPGNAPPSPGVDRNNEDNAIQTLRAGRQIFRYETFGDEKFWGDSLRLHQAVAGLSPKAALGVGLKVDVDVLPADVLAGIRAGRVNLDDPATTLTLLRADAVVGVKGIFNSSGQMQSMGIRCAFCHSTVDNSVSAGIGHRLDGWPNRDLNVGAIISLAPNLQPVTDLLGVDEATVKQVLASWGPGKFDAELFLDGKGFQPDGRSAATVIPAAFGLAGVNLTTNTGWGSITYWNAFVANLEMHGQGNFFDPRLDDAERFPVAARARSGHVQPAGPDLITDKLAALQLYQLSIPAPTPPQGSFKPAQADRGRALFNGKAQCAQCHVPPLFTEPGWNMHTAAEIGIDDFQSSRSPDDRYRTTPLRGLFTRTKGGFYHDGRFADLNAVVEHYNGVKELGLTDAEKAELVEYLKSL